MKFNVRRKIFLVLAILCAAIIFAFSSRNGNESTHDSYRVGMKIAKIFVADFENWKFDRQVEFAKKIDYPIRKTAHATEYAILGFLIMGVVYGWYKNSKSIIISWIVGAIYASTDEIHQLFVPGRSGKITDVLIDSTGVIAGVLAMLVIFSIIKAMNRRSERECHQ